MQDQQSVHNAALRRSGFRTAAALAIVIVAGVICRAFPTPLFVRKDVADALWAMAIYLFVRLLWPRARIASVVVVAMAIAFGIELSKLSHADWLEACRATWVGSVLLGRYFHPGDFVRCAAGIAVGAAVDIALRRQFRARFRANLLVQGEESEHG